MEGHIQPDVEGQGAIDFDVDYILLSKEQEEFFLEHDWEGMALLYEHGIPIHRPRYHAAARGHQTVENFLDGNRCAKCHVCMNMLVRCLRTPAPVVGF
jgi:hypothetical protein